MAVQTVGYGVDVVFGGITHWRFPVGKAVQQKYLGLETMRSCDSLADPSKGQTWNEGSKERSAREDEHVALVQRCNETRVGSWIDWQAKVVDVVDAFNTGG